MLTPLCFVLMPFGKKPDTSGKMIDFDAVYNQVIRPAIEDAKLEPIRADEEMSGGIIQKPMFERLILCPFAVADLTTANANVFYELGVRHAVRPVSTALLFATGGRLPFDVADLRALPYDLDANGRPAEAEKARKALADRLRYARQIAHEQTTPDADSPIFTLIRDFPSIVQHLKTNEFQDRVVIAQRLEKELREATSTEELKTFETKLGDLTNVEAAVLVKLFLAYRDKKAWDEMVALEAAMPRPLATTVLVQEQLAFALNRAGKSADAERVLTALIAARGGTSETYGLLGRVYKDRWLKAVEADDPFTAEGELDKAIETYRKGFEADWRDAYPGINAVTLMEIKEPPDEARLDILPVVRYAALRRAESPSADYFDFATLLEIDVLTKNEDEGKKMAGKALSAIRATWEPETTLKNLRMIREARKRRGEDEPPWIGQVMQALEKKSQ